MDEGARKKPAKASHQIRLADVHELKALAIEEYQEYLKLVKNAEWQQQKLQQNWDKFHLFYEQNGLATFGHKARKKKHQGMVNNKNEKDKKKEKLHPKYSSSHCVYYDNYQSIEDDLKIIKRRERKRGCYYFKANNNNDNSKNFILHILKDIPLAVELYINIKIEAINKIKNNVLTNMNNFCKTRMDKIILLILLCEVKLNNLYIRQKDVTHGENKADIHLTRNIIRLCHGVIEEVTRKLIPFFFSFNIFSPPDYFNYRFEHFHTIVQGIVPIP
ncbi:conserved Plasmodium protein, unknown function [Plasmodium knowlesi strain H]|uniref:Uncharacterized protein n=3 Tax=Plasmodium knowlesi TaxID=5850 RepID=A0A1A7W239_PLAKH|nr:conserved Plasmodium protein, unknown function [Plasmodium knowlesi strain H]OTN66334.1 Uncharacterized protein PKNOH_S09511200 [Plasmodium knowlesi]CAA9986285.1 conserved Plasmodium protein, unknown function [Plasmodium knowlesi strain H]SBO25505.1 conserved Plasmodium protein, unknown function [Plasmodium knowlesi strain H]SBO28271.1 conserved Plasmodium protein, unknown function [Plasmodium knowlesi strain H]VVS75759.1 conserved Plasmodium protein, unknown function [Plasmodium knowlesi s